MGIIEDAKTTKSTGEIWKTMIANITSLCELNGITLSELAKEIGVSESFFKRSRSDISLSRAIAIGDALGVNAEKLWDDAYTAEIRRRTLDAQIEKLQEARRLLENE